MKKLKMPFGRKVAALICVSAGIFFILGLFLVYAHNLGLLRQTSGEAAKAASFILSQSVADAVAKEAELVKANASLEMLINAAAEKNAGYAGMNEAAIQRYFLDMDNKWTRPSGEAPPVSEYLENKASLKLKSLTSEAGSGRSMLITDRRGGLVASSKKPARFYQGGQDWWKRAAAVKNKGLIVELVYEEESGMWLLAFAAPLINEAGETLGVYRSDIDISLFFKPLGRFKTGKTGAAFLVDDKGYLVFHEDAAPYVNKFASYADLEKALRSKGKWVSIDSVYRYKGKTLTAFNEVTSPILVQSGIKWYVFIAQDRKEVFLPLNRSVRQLFLIGIVMTAVLFFFGLFLGTRLLEPLDRLREGMERFGQGDFEYKVDVETGDEIEGLAESFNEMEEDFKKVAVPIASLDKEARDRMKTEEKVAFMEQAWQETFDSISDGIFMLDNDYVIRKSNKAFLKMVGLRPEEAIGRKCYEVLHKTDKMWPGCPFGVAKEGKNPHTEEIYEPTLGIPLLLSITPVLDEKKKVKGWIHIAKDMSVVKKTEAELAMRTKELEREKGLSADLLYSMSILGGSLSAGKEALKSTLNEKTLKLDDRHKALLEEAQNGIGKLQRVMLNIIDIAKIEEGRGTLKREVVDFMDVLKEAVFHYEPRIREKGLDLKVSIPKGRAIQVYADRAKINLVLDNLIDNSVKFTSRGYIKISLKDHEDFLECSVADTGVGIPKDDMGRVFEKFQRFGKPESELEHGVGLGLSLTNAMVELHKGKIWVESELGKGTTFTFMLPKYKEQ